MRVLVRSLEIVKNEQRSRTSNKDPAPFVTVASTQSAVESGQRRPLSTGYGEYCSQTCLEVRTPVTQPVPRS